MAHIPGSGNDEPSPAFYGFVQTSMDGLQLIEACLQGICPLIWRRPSEGEKEFLTKSGYVFVFDERVSGIKRWTDTVIWSPSRTMGNFLFYRELDKDFPPGTQRRVLKKARSYRPLSIQTTYYSPSESTPTAHQKHILFDTDVDRKYVGPLTDTYEFKEGGLIKKSMSVRCDGATIHLVSYYSLDDVKSGRLKRPCQDPRIANLRIRDSLLRGKKWKYSLQEEDFEDGVEMVPAMDQITPSPPQHFGHPSPHGYHHPVQPVPVAYAAPDMFVHHQHPPHMENAFQMLPSQDSKLFKYEQHPVASSAPMVPARHVPAPLQNLSLIQPGVVSPSLVSPAPSIESNHTAQSMRSASTSDGARSPAEDMWLPPQHVLPSQDVPHIVPSQQSHEMQHSNSQQHQPGWDIQVKTVDMGQYYHHPGQFQPTPPASFEYEPVLDETWCPPTPVTSYWDMSSPPCYPQPTVQYC